jgi:hypothetical protein
MNSSMTRFVHFQMCGMRPKCPSHGPSMPDSV